MEPIVSTSFIPKRPVSTESVSSSGGSRSGRSIGLLSIVTIVVIIGTVVAFVGVYLYQQTLQAQQTKLQQQISVAQNGLGSSFVSDMKRLSLRISGVNTLLTNHVVVSPIFAALQSTTLQTVQYKTFTYQFVTDPSTNAKLVQVQISGIAKDYNTLALQSDAYAQSSLINEPVFSNLTVEDKSSLVDFKLVFTVNPNSLSYESFIQGKGAASATASQGLPQ